MKLDISFKIRSQLKRINSLVQDGFAHIFFGTFLNKAVTMISSVVIARLVSKEQYAYLSYSDTIYGYILLFSGMGLSSALLKVCSGNNSYSKDRGYLSYVMKTGVLVELPITLFPVLVLLLIDLPFEQAKQFIFTAVLYPVIYYIYDTLLIYIRTKKMSKIYAGVNLLYSILTCVISIVLVLFADAIGIIYARYITLLILSLIVGKIVFGIVGNFKKDVLTKSEKKQLWTLAISLMIASAFSRMIPYNENMLLSHIIADEEILANYRVANLFPQMTLLIAQAVNVYFFPFVVQKVNQREQIKSYVIKIECLNFVIVCVACVVGLILTPMAIPLIYGENYRNACEISNYLWLMGGLNAGIRMVPLNMLVAIGEHKFNLILSIATFGFQFVVEWYSISKFGLHGVVIGAVVTYFISSVFLWWRFMSKVDL